jgi:sulfatase modifying factor 1
VGRAGRVHPVRVVRVELRLSPEKLYTDILLGFEAQQLTTKAVKKPKGVLQAVEVFDGDNPVGRLYLRSKVVHVRVRGAPRTEQVSSVQEAVDLLAPAKPPPAAPPPVSLSEALAAFGKGDVEAAQEKARAVIEASPGNEAARRLLEKCERLLRTEKAAGPGPAEEAEATREEVEGTEPLAVAAAPEAEPPGEQGAALAKEPPSVAALIQETAEERPVEAPPPPSPEAPPEAPEEVTGGEQAGRPGVVTAVKKPAPEVPPALGVGAPPSKPVPRRAGWRSFAWFGLAAAVVLVVVFLVRGRGEAPAPPVPEQPEVAPEEARRSRLSEMGEEARRMEGMGEWWGGESSAGALYAAVLEEEPLSPAARVGALRVADSLRMRADTTFANADFVRAAGHYGNTVELLRRCLNALPGDSAFRRRLSEAQSLLSVSQLRAPLFETLVYVPSGVFVRGDNDGPLDSRPRRRHVLPEFWMDRHEVTNAHYALFVEATGHAPPSHWPEGGVPAEQASQPVVNVSWRDASEFARWAGKRLPTEAEWEKAARGTDGNRYPWGSRFSAELCNTREGEVRAVAPVGSYPGGASPYGAGEMAGNVREWTADFYDGRYYLSAPERDPNGPRSGTSRVVRGGSWRLSREWALTFARGRLHPDERQSDLGFRCASDKGPAPLGDPAATPPTE